MNLQLQNIYQDEFLKVEVDEAASYMYVEWFCHPDSQNFRLLFQKLADLTIQNKTKYWMSDARAILYIEFADQNWILSEIIPMLRQSHLLKFARITTAESLLLLDVARVIDVVSKLTELEIKTKLEMFTEKQAALEWLFSDVN